MQRLRAERYAADGRNPVVLRRTAQEHPRASWGQRPTHQGRQQEASFGQKSDVCPAPPSLPEDTRKLIGLPAFYLLVVALAGPGLGLVPSPGEARPCQLACLFGVSRRAGPAL